MLKGIIFGSAATLAFGANLSQAADLSFDVNVIGEVKPGVYGRLELGNAPPPPVVYPQPVVIAPPAPQAVAVQPIYLHVPPEHAHDWARHCHKYHACDRPVYFVKSEEYAREHHANQNFDRGRHEGDYREHERREREYLEHEYRERHGERD